MRVRRLTLGPLDTNCWLADDGVGGPVVVIDPADEADAVLAAVDGAQVQAVVLTHGHFDHIGAVAEVVAATGAPFSSTLTTRPRSHRPQARVERSSASM